MATVAASELDSVTPAVADVQFVPGVGKDAKVDINYSAPKSQDFVGLGKDDLERYVNDPFWVRLRWILFIAFWVLWVGLLAGAMLIIFLSDGCPSPSENNNSTTEAITKAIESIIATTLAPMHNHGHHNHK